MLIRRFCYTFLNTIFLKSTKRTGCSVMKLKVLINCRHSRLVEDLMSSRSSSFDCLTTSGYTQDILRHVEVYQPNVFLSFWEKYDYEVVQQYYMLKRERSMYRLPFVVISRDDVCDTCTKYDSELFSAILRRPITVFKIRERLKQVTTESLERQLHSNAPAPDTAAELELTEDGSDSSAPFQEKKRILIVDDDKNMLRMLKLALEKRYDVTTLTSGRMAQKYLETKSADLILLDYQMPHENGAVVLKKSAPAPSTRTSRSFS